MKKKTLALVLAAVMALGLAGCGNSDATATDASGKKWIIATDTSFKPFEYTDDAGNSKTLDDAALVFSYKKSTGGFDRHDAKQIVVTGASREYTITCYKVTGKVTME